MKCSTTLFSYGLLERRIVNGRPEQRLTGKILFNPARLYEALKDKTPKRVFVNEFSDLLHPALPIAVVLEHFRVFAAASQHQFQVLTKRSARLPEVDRGVLKELGTWPSNVWMGVSVCSDADREFARIHALGETATAVRWISFEPWISNRKRPLRESRPDLRATLASNKIDWIVVGGESGDRTFRLRPLREP